MHDQNCAFVRNSRKNSNGSVTTCTKARTTFCPGGVRFPCLVGSWPLAAAHAMAVSMNGRNTARGPDTKNNLKSRIPHPSATSALSKGTHHNANCGSWTHRLRLQYRALQCCTVSRITGLVRFRAEATAQEGRNSSVPSLRWRHRQNRTSFRRAN